MTQRRKDFKKAELVERMIRIGDKGFIRDAAIVGASNKVPIGVALRVLTAPNHRRKYK